MKEMTIKETQQVSLEILKDVHEFCVENNLKYSLSGGTLIGAIRHNGFIPWDDDIDIQMPQPDYEKFIRSYKSKKGYKVFSYEVNGDIVNNRIAQVCEMEKTYVDQGPIPLINENVGVMIDVIPVYGAPDNEIDAKKHFEKLVHLCHKVSIWQTKFATWNQARRYNRYRERIKFYIKKVMAVFMNRNCLTETFLTYKLYQYDNCDYMLAGTHNGIGEWQPKKNMESYMLHQFEDSEFYIMSGFDDNLRSMFGDYMQLPPKSKRCSVHVNKNYWR